MRWRNRVAMAVMAAVLGMALAREAAAGEVRLPDTGQTKSYTNIVGEDHDYRRPRSYSINTNGTVIDNVTGLMWQRQDDGVTRIWTAATTYCADLTLAAFTDWRLPSVQELQTLVNYGTLTIDISVFPGAKVAYYWSSMSEANGSNDAWYVGFSNGYVYYDNKTSSYYVRCVRNGQ